MSALEPIPLDVGPPYAPRIAVLGLIPTVRVDVPICIILIVFFLAAAAVNLTIFIRNKSAGHNFLPSTVLVGFCTTRIIALSLRIAWATQPVNVKLNIAATIFAAAGVVLLFVLNLLFAHRLLRALHPNIGWLPAANYLFLFLYAYVLVCLLCAVTAAVVSYYTLAPDQLYKCRLVQLFASTSLALLAFLPVLLVLGALFYPGLRRPEPFGHGSISTKALLVLTTALLLTIGAAYRCAVNFAVRPVWFPAWWHHKACYYIFNYDLELVVVFAYALMRFDMRFHVPDGACKPGDYAKGLHVYKRVSTLAKVHGRRRADVEMCCPPSCSSRTCGSDYGSTQSSTSRSSRSGVIRGLSEVDDLRTVTDTTRSSYPSTYLGSSYDSQTRSSETAGQRRARTITVITIGGIVDAEVVTDVRRRESEDTKSELSNDE
ncbi:hypothetical protein CTRI78_v004551 [Colletotrichum trifolii]|uniref:Family c-likeg-protein-coupled receptor protein n=1 Tax=Colletotrichum trifolii TaxID=5466 RepID=A0A4R8RGU8_COLTR|nr:hypothetical protein CTRI78_v004551 [Colletotrichum trifolii]